MENRRQNYKKYADIFQDLKAADIMTKDLVTLSPDKKVSQAKELMKIRKISGIPIVDKENTLLGIISIEDIIKALETNTINNPLSQLMSKKVMTLKPNENLASIVEKFHTRKVGRFPVVNKKNQILGIITKEDIQDGILEKFNLLYIHDKKRNSTLNQEFSFITGEKLTIKDAKFHYEIDTDIPAAGTGAALLKQFLKQQKISDEICRKVGIAAYEAETNVVIHSQSRGDIYCFLREDRIIVRVTDSGIGIEDIGHAMVEGFSTAPDHIREMGFGAGMGIPNMKRFSDKLMLISEKNIGTQVELVFFLNPNYEKE
jgi:CBS domain-containing protein/anti-sigma regulatory factor (Ser/Thr protein kinase)